MHTSPMQDSDGGFSPPVPNDFPCSKCGALTLLIQKWESSCGGYTDWRHECTTCKHTVWHEGIDS